MKSLRSRLMVSVGLIILMVLGTSTWMHINDLKHDYRVALEERSEAMVQGLKNDVMTIYQQELNENDVLKALSGLSVQCLQLYESNKDKHVVSIAIINPDGIIIAHNDGQFRDAPYRLPQFKSILNELKRQTLLTEQLFHTFIPLVAAEQRVLGVIEIVVSEELFQQKVHQVLFHALLLFLVFLSAA